MEDVHNLLNIGPTNPIPILNQHEFFWRFCMCPSNDTFDKNKKILMSVLGLNSKDRRSTRYKANISNPKVNRCCAPLTANRTLADCVQISLVPSIPYIPLGVFHTAGFNAIKVQAQTEHWELYNCKHMRVIYLQCIKVTWGYILSHGDRWLSTTLGVTNCTNSGHSSSESLAAYN